MEPETKITRAFVTEKLGEIEDDKLSALLATGATEDEFREAAEWAEGQHGVIDDDLAHPLTGATAAVYDILVGDEWEED